MAIRQNHGQPFSSTWDNYASFLWFQDGKQNIPNVQNGKLIHYNGGVEEIFVDFQIHEAVFPLQDNGPLYEGKTIWENV